jgi:type II secretory pathway pseudopilin PulG
MLSFFKTKKVSIISTKAFALVEIIVASAIMLIAIIAASNAYSTYVQYALANERNVQAGYLLEETIEGVTYLRDKGWTTNIASLTAGTTYYLYFNGSLWTATTTPQYVDGQFLRSFTLSNVNRDSGDDIAVSGTLDPKTKQVTANVAFFQGHATTTQSVYTYITNINND